MDLTAPDASSWKLYLIFMALCFLMAIVIYFTYPVSTLDRCSFMAQSYVDIGISWENARRDGLSIF